MYWDHIVKGGTIVTSKEEYRADIYIKDGKIAAISDEELEGESKEITDATGRYVFSGFIDTHSHSRDGFDGPHHKEDFFHSSMAGAVGGITTIYEMPNCNPAIYKTENLDKLIECITPKAHTDFAVWGLSLGDLNLHELAALDKAGVVGFKYFWGYAIDSKTYQLIYNYKEGMENVIPPHGNGEIYKIFREAAKTGKMVAIHAEDFDIIKVLTAEVIKSGEKDYEAFLRTRPEESELTIIDTAIEMAEALNAHLHILHLAAGKGVDRIKKAQERGVKVTVETCSHYLALTNEDYAVAGPLMKGYPPIRTKKDQQLLWEGINSGVINHVCSDHAPHTYEEKQMDLWTAPAGMTNIELLAPIMINAVNEGKITRRKLAEVMSENPAKLFGLYPQKGSLEVGTDADIAVVDMDEKYTVDQTKLHSRTKLTPYNGFKMQGKVKATILRGKTVARDGEIVAEPFGRFVRPE